MSDGNGKTPTLEELREQYRLERAQGRLALARAERQMREALGGGLNFAWGDYASPYSFRRDDFGSYWLPSAQQGAAARKDGALLPDFGSDADLDRMRTAARYLALKNDLAIGALDTLCNFTVKKGYDWDTRPAEGYETDARAALLAARVKRVIKRHDQTNGCPARERSAFVRAVRDGDVLTRHFAQADGTTVMRFVAAEQLRDPGGRGPHCSFGIETDPHDVETHRAYWVTYDGTESEPVPADECSFLSRNTDEEVKRGVSDFFSAGESFDDVAKLLRNMRKGGGVLAAIAYIEQYENATRDQLNAFSTGQTDLNPPAREHPVTGRQINYQQFDPGTIIRMNRGKSYLPPPLAANSNNFGLIVQACLRAVGVRWGMPEFIVSGDSSNANYASTLVSGSPFVNATECNQSKFGLFFLRWRWIAVRNACDAGLIDATFEEVQALVDIHYTPPLVAIASELDQAAIDHGDMDRGALSVQTRQARRKLDPEQERKNIAEHPMTRQPGRAIDLDAAGNPITAQTRQAAGAGPPPPPARESRRLGEGSYFSDCDRDEKGYCLPGGGGADKKGDAGAAGVRPDKLVAAHEVAPLNETSQSKVKELARSMEENGWVGPPLVVTQNSAGEFDAWTGSHRAEAARRADLRIPVVVLDEEDVAAAAEAEGVSADPRESNNEEKLAIIRRIGNARALRVMQHEFDTASDGIESRLDRIERALVRLLEYSDDQERDYHGRFGSGGAPEGGGAGQAAGRVFAGRDDAKAWAAETFGEVVKGYDLQEKYAAGKYAGGAYQKINAALRGQDGPKSVQEQFQIDNVTKGLDSALARTTLPEAVTAWRGVGPGVLPADLAPLVGTTLPPDAGYTSTSLNRATAEPYATRGGVLVEVRLPRGTHVVPVTLAAGTSAEQELLLGRGTAFRVLSAEGNKLVVEPAPPAGGAG